MSGRVSQHATAAAVAPSPVAMKVRRLIDPFTASHPSAANCRLTPHSDRLAAHPDRRNSRQFWVRDPAVLLSVARQFALAFCF